VNSVLVYQGSGFGAGGVATVVNSADLTTPNQSVTFSGPAHLKASEFFIFSVNSKVGGSDASYHDGQHMQIVGVDAIIVLPEPTTFAPFALVAFAIRSKHRKTR
jgi:hypothetical protein